MGKINIHVEEVNMKIKMNMEICIRCRLEIGRPWTNWSYDDWNLDGIVMCPYAKFHRQFKIRNKKDVRILMDTCKYKLEHLVLNEKNK